MLIKVRAVSVNPYDWHFMRGEPRIMRIGNGLRKPTSARMGIDFSGVVEAVGKNITQFKPGDEVFGGRTGAFAEYVCMSETKPDAQAGEHQLRAGRRCSDRGADRPAGTPRQPGNSRPARKS